MTDIDGTSHQGIKRDPPPTPTPTQERFQRSIETGARRYRSSRFSPNDNGYIWGSRGAGNTAPLTVVRTQGDTGDAWLLKVPFDAGRRWSRP